MTARTPPVTARRPSRRIWVRTAPAVAAALVALGGVPPALAVPLASSQAPAPPPVEVRTIATSTQGRPITARLYGEPDAPVRVVVIGQMHGSEPGGRTVVDALARRPVPAGVGLWLIRTVNPDGAATGSRRNAAGVDLNRNFPARWRPSPRGSVYWSGPRAASEPETRGVVRFLTAVRPTAVLSLHQAFDRVDVTNSRAAGRRLARWMGERAAVVGCAGPCHGTMTQWISRRLDAVALTVELDAHVSAREASTAATAMLRLARWLGR